MFHLSIRCVIPVLLLFGNAMAAPLSFSTLDELIRSNKARMASVSGTAVAVIHGDKVIYEGYFGYADIEHQKPVDRDTVFYIASATKPFFALNTLLQMQQGKLPRDINLQAMFPATQFEQFDAKAVTLIDLLTHTSGLDNPSLVWASAFSGLHDKRSRERLIAQTRTAVDVSHGEFNYSNVGYNMASEWLDSSLQTPWQKQLRDTIFSPLNMSHTSAYISTAISKKWTLAKPYSAISREPNKSLYLVKTDNTMHAAGGMISTAADLATFMLLQLNSGKLGNETFLPAAVIAQSQTQQAKTEAEYQDFNRDGYAWGWYTGNYKNERLLHHFGSFSGFHAHLSMMPKASIGLVILNNEDFLSANMSSLIADYVYGLLLNEADIQSKVVSRFEELYGKAQRLPQMVAQQHEKLQSRVSTLSQDPAHYVGVYKNDLLGEFTITQNQQKNLALRWGQLNAIASAYEKPDSIRAELVPNSGEVISFGINGDQVESLELNSMLFKKVR